jgi:hypothetical protein
MKFILNEGEVPEDYFKYLTINKIYEGKRLLKSYIGYIVIKADDGEFRHYKEIYFKTLRDEKLNKILDNA